MSCGGPDGATSSARGGSGGGSAENRGGTAGATGSSGAGPNDGGTGARGSEANGGEGALGGTVHEGGASGASGGEGAGAAGQSGSAGAGSEGNTGNAGGVSGENGGGGQGGAPGGDGDGGSNGSAENPCTGGELLWAKPVARLSNGAYVYARSVAALSDGSSVVVGMLNGGGLVRFGGGTPSEVALNAGGAFWAKFDGNGELLGARRATGAWVDGIAAASRNDGSFVFAGYFRDSVTFDAGLPSQRVLRTADPQGQDAFLVRIGADGNVVWALQGRTALSTIVLDVEVLPNGNVVVLGTGAVTYDDGTTSLTTGASAYHVAVFGSAGTPLWSRSFTAGDQVRLGTLDDGSIAVTGRYFERATFEGDPDITLTGVRTWDSLFVARWLGDGTLTWARKATDRSVGFGVLSGDAGTVLVTGYAEADAVFNPGEPSERTAGTNGMFIAHYSPSGALLALHTNGDTYENEWDVVRTPNGALVSTGRAFSPSRFGGMSFPTRGGVDAFVLCQSSSGDFGWVSRVASAGSDIGTGVALLPNGDVIATGQYTSAPTAAYETSAATELPIDLGFVGAYLVRYRP